MLSNEEYAYFKELKEELAAQKDLVSMYSRALKESQDTIDALVKEKEEAEEKADDLASSVSDMMTDHNVHVSELEGQITSLKKELEARDKTEWEYDDRIQELEEENAKYQDIEESFYELLGYIGDETYSVYEIAAGQAFKGEAENDHAILLKVRELLLRLYGTITWAQKDGPKQRYLFK